MKFGGTWCKMFICYVRLIFIQVEWSECTVFQSNPHYSIFCYNSPPITVFTNLQLRLSCTVVHFD